MSDIVIDVRNVSKRYKLGQYNSGTLYRDLQSRIAEKLGRLDPNSKIGTKSRRELDDYFSAIDDVSFKIERGSRVGIIGRNGAGKSTLLKLLSQITAPSEGEIRINGRIASLLEVGTGFHPEMTGRENIYLNGTIMGMKRYEISKKIDEIIEFSGIGEHIDTPVKRYSSGMYVRLGFAVAANLESDILIADEVLAVGDAEFQKRAIGKMNEVSKGEGRTVLFVSHQMNAVKTLCNEGIVLNHGKIVKEGPIDSCVVYYQKGAFEEDSEKGLSKYNNEFFDLLKFEVIDGRGELVKGAVTNDEEHFVRISFNLKKLHSAFTIGYAVYNDMGELIYWTNATDDYEEYENLNIGINTIEGEIPSHFLNEGVYYIKLMTGIHFQEWIINPSEEAPSMEYEVQGGLSSSPFWTIKRPGLCAPILKWKNVE